MKILIVEDQGRHRLDAVTALLRARIDFVVADNETEAYDRLEEGGFDGVITDIFMPHMRRKPYDHSDDPCGIAVALYADLILEIPFIICIEGHHLDPHYHWIYLLGHQQGWPGMIDRPEAKPGDEAASKDWTKAINNLLKLIVEKKK